MEKGNLYRLVNILLLVFISVDIMHNDKLFLAIDTLVLIGINLKWYIFRHRSSQGVSIQKVDEEIAQAEAEKSSIIDP